MIQPIYTSISNANIRPCDKKGSLISSEPIPLLKDKYLGEYRTALEKAKVRKNLGIADDLNLEWGNISGHIESQTDLTNYIETKWAYSTDLVENIHNIKDAIDYALYFISLYEANTEDIADLYSKLSETNTALSTLETNLTNRINNNDLSITNILESINTINQNITLINQNIETIDVDRNINAWVTARLENSTSLLITDDIFNIKVSESEDNAVSISEGLYVKNLEPTIEETKLDLESLIEDSSVYKTELPDESLSPVLEGTTVASLKGKTFNEIIDVLIFPTVTRDLVQPELIYTLPQSVVKVGSNLLQSTIEFIKNDAGEKTNETELVTYNSSPVTSYNNIGNYIHTASVSYEAGEYLIDNKGEITNKRVEAGTISKSLQVIATYPWYAGDTTSVTEQELIPYNTSQTMTISLTGNSVIKIPGANSTLNSFTVDGGLGYLPVNLGNWNQTTEQLNGITYKVWTKQDSYSGILPHQINFTLRQ